jgi:peroxiredoxin
VCLAFGMVGTRRGRPRAATFMIDRSGLVKRVFTDVPPYGHAKDVLAEAETLWGGY